MADNLFSSFFFVVKLNNFYSKFKLVKENDISKKKLNTKETQLTTIDYIQYITFHSDIKI